MDHAPERQKTTACQLEIDVKMNLFKRSTQGIFASESFLGHLVRGAAGIALLVWAVRNQGASPALALIAGISALVAFRGCPICWAIGLIETISYKVRKLHKGSLEK